MFESGGTATENHGFGSYCVAQPVVCSLSTQLLGWCEPGSVDVVLITAIDIGTEQSIWLSGTGGGLGKKENGG
jgi:hypothetical protein